MRINYASFLATICLLALLSLVLLAYGGALNLFGFSQQPAPEARAPPLQPQGQHGAGQQGQGPVVDLRLAFTAHGAADTQPQPVKEKAAAVRMHVATYASHGGRDDRFCRAVESAYQHKIELIILGIFLFVSL